MQELQKAMEKVQQSLNDVFAKLPPEMSAQIPKVHLDVNQIIKAVKNEDMDKLTELTKKYANKNNK